MCTLYATSPTVREACRTDGTDALSSYRLARSRLVTVPLVGGDGGGGTVTLTGNQPGSAPLMKRSTCRRVRAYPVSGGLVVKAPEKPDEKLFKSTVSLSTRRRRATGSITMSAGKIPIDTRRSSTPLTPSRTLRTP